jgi:hypothetical protein
LGNSTLKRMDMNSLYGDSGGGGGGSGKAASSSSSSTSGNNFGSGQLVSDGALTPLAGLILAGLSFVTFLALIIIAKK